MIWLYDEHEHDRVHKRIKVTSEILSEINVNNIFLKCDGSNAIVRQLKLIQLVDMVSYYLAIIAGIDPVPVNRIMTLKDRMSR